MQAISMQEVESQQNLQMQFLEIEQKVKQKLQKNNSHSQQITNSHTSSMGEMEEVKEETKEVDMFNTTQYFADNYLSSHLETNHPKSWEVPYNNDQEEDEEKCSLSNLNFDQLELDPVEEEQESGDDEKDKIFEIEPENQFTKKDDLLSPNHSCSYEEDEEAMTRPSSVIEKLFPQKDPTETPTTSSRYGNGSIQKNKLKLLRKKKKSMKTVPPPPPPPPSPPNSSSSSRKIQADNHTVTGSVLPDFVEDKLKELEDEIAKYKNERQKMKSSMLENEKKRKSLSDWQQQEHIKMQDMQERHDRELKDMEKRHSQEVGRLKLQLKQKSLSRQERTEISALKAQIVQMKVLEEEATKKQKVSKERMRKRISELERRNQELQSEIQVFETTRLHTKQRQQPMADFNYSLLTNHHITKAPSKKINVNSSSLKKKTFHSSSNGNRSNGYDPGRYNVVESIVDETDELNEKESPKSKNSSINSSMLVDEINHPDGKIERVFEDGRRLILFKNKTEKEIFSQGHVVVRFPNGDVKKTFPDSGIVVYYYAEAKTTHTTYPDQTQVFDFPTNQTEKHYADGSIEIYFPNGTQKIIKANGEEQTFYPNGEKHVE